MDRPTMKPYGRHLLLCKDGSCSGSDQAEELHRQASELNRRHGLNKLSNPHRIKCTLTGCLGVCTGGPVAVVYPEGVWYAGLDAERLQRIYERHLLGGEVVDDLVSHRLFPAGKEPSYAPAARGDGKPPALVQRISGSIAPASEAEAAQAEAFRKSVRRTHRPKGLLIINTGDGKGKTTAAVGLMTRAWGRRMRVGVIQFLKNENARFGEILAGRRMGIDWIATGDGWTWTSRDGEETAARARRAWQIAQEKILKGNYQLLILDEFTYALHFGWLETQSVVEWLRDNKPPSLHVVITGRYAPSELIEAADLVTEMREIKHPFRQQGIRAQKGIEF